jgi:hypothetical protein
MLLSVPSRWELRALIFSAAAATATALVIVASGDTLVGGLAFVGLLAIVFASVYSLEWGLYMFVGIFLAFDQFEVPDFNNITYKANYFNNINTITYLPKIEAASISPMELHLVFLVVLWILAMVFRTNPSFRRPAVWPLGVGFLFWILTGYAYGTGMGGDAVVALWEMRGLFYMLAMYLFVPQIIQTREQIQRLLWVCIVAITFKACEGTGRLVSLGMSRGGHDALLTHEDPVFMVTLVILLLGMVTFGVRSVQRRVLTWILPLLVLGYYAANRRAAYASLAVSLLTYAALLPPVVLRRVAKYASGAVVVLALYTAAFWGSTSPIASPINQIRSGFADDEETLGERNFYSNLYRKLENFNLAATIRRSPLLGIGFGTKYDQPLTLVQINYALRDYMAHNNILWLLVKVGGIGFFLFWLFIDAFAARGAFVLSALDDPFLKAVCILVVVAVINQLVAAFFDLHLVRYRTMLYMGTLMGLLPALDRLAHSTGTNRGDRV